MALKTNPKKKKSTNKQAKKSVKKSIRGKVSASSGAIKDRRKISFIIPFLNEEDSLEILYSEIMNFLDIKSVDYEIIFINDGSTDNSLDRILGLRKNDKKIKVISFNRNYGKSAALDTGFKYSTGELVFTVDADLQDNPAEIPNIIQTLDEGYDVISGWKFVRKDPISKRPPSKIYNSVTAFMTGVNIHDINCGFKLYRRSVVKEMKIYGTLHRFIPIFAFWSGFRVSEIKVEHRPREYGVSKFGLRRYYRGFFDLLTVLFLTRFRDRPLHLFGSLGLLFSVSGFLINLGMSIYRFIYGSFNSRTTILWLGILLMILGVQLFSTGLIAELITKYNFSSKSYIIKELFGLNTKDD